VARPGPTPRPAGDPERWTSVDGFLESQLLPHDDVLEAALADSEKAELPAIQVSATAGMLLQLLARTTPARAILEIGTLGGYSTIWMARALAPGGTLVTLEYEPKHAQVARTNIARAGLGDAVDVIVGTALDTLPSLAGRGPFDFTFIDADKGNNAVYFDWAVKLSHPGSLIVVDNVVRGGEVLNAGANAEIDGMRAVLALIGKDARVDGTAVQTVGVKGWDGFAIARVR
jgi:predicted O-methyltransferase YrrM